MSHRKEVILSIPQPCHENWDAMTPHDQGRHCASCRKTVIDFTRMSDDQILGHLSQNCGNICGRFETTQLDRNLIYPQQYSSPVWRKLFLTLTFGLGLANSALSQNALVKTGEVQVEKPVREKRTKWKEIKQPAGQITGNFIKGKVTDARTGEELPFAFIKVEETSKICQTDLNGNFSIPLHDSIQREFVTLSCRLVGYSTSFTKVRLPVKSNFHIKITIKEHAEALGYLEIIQVKRSLWHRIVYRIKKFRDHFRNEDDWK